MKILLPLFVLLLNFTIAKTQTAVYMATNNACGYCYGRADVKNCAYNECIARGGISPWLLYYTESKGYGAIYSGYNYESKLVIGVTAGFSTLERAKLEAYNYCIQYGGKTPQLVEAWNDFKPITNQHTQGIVPYSDCIKTLNVSGFKNVKDATANKSHKYLFLKAATIINCGETKKNTYSPTGDIGLHIYGGSNYEINLAKVRLYGPYYDGIDNDGSYKYEWMNHCTVYYNYFALLDITNYNFQNVRIRAVEGDDFFDKLGLNVPEDDVVFDAIINLGQISAGDNTITGHCDIPSKCATLMFDIDSYEANTNCGFYWNQIFNSVRPLPATSSMNKYDPRKWGTQVLALGFWVSEEAYNFVKSKAGMGIYPHQWAVIEYADGYCIFNRFQARRTIEDVINHATGHGDGDWWPWPEGSQHVNLSTYQSAINLAQTHRGIRDIRWIDHPTANCGY